MYEKMHVLRKVPFESSGKALLNIRPSKDLNID